MEELSKLIKSYQNNPDLALVKKAFNFARDAHADQKRYSGELYWIHPVAVAKILAGWHMDTESIIAGLLHDTIEDGVATKEDIVKEFGETVFQLVDGVTKVSKVKLRGSSEEELVENLRKMFLAMAKDLRVVIVKLADRLHNMRTVQFIPTEVKRKKFAKESLEVYASLADRLSMGLVKGELEDLSFPILYPDDYEWLKKYASPFYKEAEKHVLEIKQKLLRKLADESVQAIVSGRTKHFYSLYKKLLRPEIARDISKIHDIEAIRVIVDTVEHCYLVLGVVHKLYRPVPSVGVSDFIALPKPNGYRSIHTKVFGPSGKIVEVQIRTNEMHEQAEYGVAAHWHYALAKSKGTSDAVLEKGQVRADEGKLSWVKQLADWQKEVSDSGELLHDLKFDALSERIFVLTPNGDVKDLPFGATPIDFAYAVHTHLGDRTTGAKVNGKMVGLDYKLKSGDVCEVMLAKEPKKPNLDWKKFVVTSLAKREIRKGWETQI